ncbi:MAG: CBS domain-containing protein [Vampirovibrio sp.]|nr:CBS domain-containing protein [Vampirovibrio sp.]
MMNEILVKQVMTEKPPCVVDESDSIARVIRLLDDHQLYALPVKNAAGVYTGVLSKSDIAARPFLIAMRSGQDPEKIPAAYLMNRSPEYFIDPETPLTDAVDVMHRHRFQQLFIQDRDGQILGIIESLKLLNLTESDPVTPTPAKNSRFQTRPKKLVG